MGDTNGQVVAGGNGKGNRLDQLYYPTDVLIDKETDSLIICDYASRRVVRWSRRSGTTQGEILIDNISCWGLAMDDQRYFYISDPGRHEVRRYQIGDNNGTLVAGGNGEGAGLNQLNWPTYIYVDQQQAVYVECLCFMGNADEFTYTVDLTSNQATSTTPSDSSSLLLPLSIHDDSPLLDLSENTTIKRKRQDKHSYINE
ncbi:unnamed protein product [Rotaria sordida]|uniref:Uncharacterized protein n=1 Tax=Rotaria sordida TaxID=392033 RepID=A0A815K3W9_9BILA|nr:unnamed protein product [Rotaria sordida]CAF1390694.1 unnamed protein product [Rotaria sordida]